MSFDRLELALCVSILIYLSIGIGTYLLTEQFIKKQITRISMYRRLRRPKSTEKWGLLKASEDFVFAVTGRAGYGKKLLFFSCGLFILLFIAVIRYLGIFMSLCMGIMIGILPYMLLRMRLERIRGKGSKEGESFVAEILSKYRIAKGNIDRTLEMVAYDVNSNNVSHKLMGRVLSKMREAKSPMELRACAESFAYAINANWADMLSYNIGLASDTGMDISSALEDILLELREARTISEERKRMNAEANRLVLFMVPFSYALTLFFSVNYLGIELSKLIKNQFGTSEGVFLFFIICFIFLLNLLLLSLVNNRKFDY